MSTQQNTLGGSDRPSEDEQVLTSLSDWLVQAREAVETTVVGQSATIDDLFLCLATGGHALVEGPPGVGKTLLVRTIAQVFGLHYSRIQFTPDLMPTDITGTHVLVHEGTATRTEFRSGPIFAQLVLADEINRATPKTQSALLEAMQESTVTVGGVERPLPRPFFVLATQNPLEMEGTYELPEAQTDRFALKVVVPFPEKAVLSDILQRTTAQEDAPLKRALEPAALLEIQRVVRDVPVPSSVLDAVSGFLVATQPQRPEADAQVRRLVRFGISPRGGQAMILAAKARAFIQGRYHVAIDDVRSVSVPALRHRLRLSFEAVTEALSVDDVLHDLLDRHLR